MLFIFPTKTTYSYKFSTCFFKVFIKATKKEGKRKNSKIWKSSAISFRLHHRIKKVIQPAMYIISNMFSCCTWCLWKSLIMNRTWGEEGGSGLRFENLRCLQMWLKKWNLFCKPYFTSMYSEVRFQTIKPVVGFCVLPSHLPSRL